MREKSEKIERRVGRMQNKIIIKEEEERRARRVRKNAERRVKRIKKE